MMHDSRSPIAVPERQHPFAEICLVQRRKDGRTSDAVAVRAMTGGARRGEHLNVGLLHRREVSRVNMQRQQRKENCLTREMRQACANQGITQSRLIRPY